MTLSSIISLILLYKYPLVFLIMVREGPVIAFVAAYMAGQGLLSFPLVCLLSVLGDVVGDSIWFWTGRLSSRHPRVQKRIAHPVIVKLHRHMSTDFIMTLLLVKVSGPLSIPGHALFGSVKMSLAKFYFWSTVLSAWLEAIFLITGYELGHTATWLLQNTNIFSTLSLGIAGGVILSLIIRAFLKRFFIKKTEELA